MSIILENETKASSLFNYTITPFKFHEIYPKIKELGVNYHKKTAAIIIIMMRLQ